MTTIFLFVTFAWIFFRLQNINDAFSFSFKILNDLFLNPYNISSKPFGWSIFLYIFPLITIDWYLKEDDKQLKVPENIFIRYTIYIIFVFFVLYYMGSNTNSFIYFQF